MKLKIMLLAGLMGCANLALGATPISGLKLIGDADANGNSITNLVTKTNIMSSAATVGYVLSKMNTNSYSGGVGGGLSNIVINGIAGTLSGDPSNRVSSVNLTAADVGADAAGTATNVVAAYSNYANGYFYPKSNPSNFVTASITNGLASQATALTNINVNGTLGTVVNGIASLTVAGGSGGGLSNIVVNGKTGVLSGDASNRVATVNLTASDVGADAAGTATNAVAGYSNYVASTYYLNSNPSNFVTASITNGLVGSSVTNGLASIVFVTNLVTTSTQGLASASSLANYYLNSNPSNFVDRTITNGLASTANLSNYYLNSNPSNFVTATITNGLVGASITNGLASTVFVTNLVTTSTQGLVTASVTNGLVSQVNLTSQLGSYYLNSNPSNFVTASITNGLVGSSVTNGLASTVFVTNLVTTSTQGLASASSLANYYLNSNPSNFVTASITNGLVTSSVTNGLASMVFVTNLVTTSTQGLVTASVTNGLVSQVNLTSQLGSYYLNSNPSNFVDRTITNGLATTANLSNYYLNSNPSNFVTASITNGLVGSSVTNGLASMVFVTNLVTTSTQGLVTASVTNGLVSQVNLTNQLGSYYLNSNPSNFVTASITNGLVGSSVTNGLASIVFVTNLVTTSTQGLASVSSLANYYLNSNPSNFVTASITNGLVGSSVTNGLASTVFVTNLVTTSTQGLVTASVTNGLVSQANLTGQLGSYYLNSNPSNFVTASITNGLASQATVLTNINVNGVAATVVNGIASVVVGGGSGGGLSNIVINGIYGTLSGDASNRLANVNLTAGNVGADVAGTATNAVAGYSNYVASTYYPNSNPSNFVNQTVTNGLVSQANMTSQLGSYYLNSNPSNFVDRTITNGLVGSSVTNGLASMVFVTNLVTTSTQGLASVSSLAGYVPTNDTRYLNAITGAVNTGASAGQVGLTNGTLSIGSYAPPILATIGLRGISYNPVDTLNFWGTNGINVSVESISAKTLTLLFKGTNDGTQVWDIAGASTNAVAGYSNYVASTYYPNSNPSNFVNQTVTNGLVSQANLTGQLGSYYLNSNPSNFVTASITNGLVTSSVTNGLASIVFVTNLVTTSTQGLVTASVTNGLVSQANLTGQLGSYYLNSNPSNFVTASVTNGLVTSSVTNGLASIVFVTNLVTTSTQGLASASSLANYYLNSNPSNFVTSSITNGLVTSSVTNGLVSTVFVTNLVTTSTQGLVTASVTNGLVSQVNLTGQLGSYYLNSNPSNFVTASITNGLASTANLSGYVVKTQALMSGNAVITGTDTSAGTGFSPQLNGIQVIGTSAMDLYYGLGGLAGMPNWWMQVYRNEHPSATNSYEFLYFSNGQSQRDILILSEGGRMALNKASNIMNYHGEYLGYGNGGILDDLNWIGTNTGSKQAMYKVVISTVGVPDQWTWQKSTDNGISWGSASSPANCSLTPAAIENGVFVYFENTTGHNLNDKWQRIAFSQLPASSYHVSPSWYAEIGHTTNYANQSGWRDDTYVMATISTATRAVLTNTTCALYLGRRIKMNSTYINVATPGVGITLVAEYWNGATWSTMGVGNNFSDGTVNLSGNGQISWDKNTMSDWTTNGITGQGAGYEMYWIRFRSSTVPTTVPTLQDITPQGKVRLGVMAHHFDSDYSFYVDGSGNVYADKGYQLSTSTVFSAQQWATASYVNTLLDAFRGYTWYLSNGNSTTVVGNRLAQTVPASPWTIAPSLAAGSNVIGTFVTTNVIGVTTITAGTKYNYTYFAAKSTASADTWCELLEVGSGITNVLATSATNTIAAATTVTMFTGALSPIVDKTVSATSYLALRVWGNRTAGGLTFTLYGGSGYNSSFSTPTLSGAPALVDAPSDANAYARKQNAWVAITPALIGADVAGAAELVQSGLNAVGATQIVNTATIASMAQNMTNGFLATTNWVTNLVTVATQGLVTASVTNGLVSRVSLTNQLASYYLNSNPSNFVTASITNGLVGSSVTNGLASIVFVTNLVTTSTQGLASASSLANYYLNSNPSNFVDRTVTNGLASTAALANYMTLGSTASNANVLISLNSSNWMVVGNNGTGLLYRTSGVYGTSTITTQMVVVAPVSGANAPALGSMFYKNGNNYNPPMMGWNGVIFFNFGTYAAEYNGNQDSDSHASPVATYVYSGGSPWTFTTAYLLATNYVTTNIQTIATWTDVTNIVQSFGYATTASLANYVLRTDTNGWTVSSHSAFLTGVFGVATNTGAVVQNSTNNGIVTIAYNTNLLKGADGEMGQAGTNATPQICSPLSFYSNSVFVISYTNNPAMMLNLTNNTTISFDKSTCPPNQLVMFSLAIFGNYSVTWDASMNPTNVPTLSTTRTNLTFWAGVEGSDPSNAWVPMVGSGSVQ